jgi:trehalose 6-phosphate synthase/phosphatase
MAQVIIVSNRLPVSVKKEAGRLVYTASLGGLATGLASYVDDKRNQWIGWPGIASDELTDRDKQEITHELAKQNCAPVFLSRKQIDEFYNGYSNEVLWPLFHGLPTRPKAVLRRRAWWRAYRSVNKQYAEVTISHARKDSEVWIHDYQLLLLPELLRTARVGRHIGFFLHIPFPTTKQFSKLAEHKKLLKGMLGADLIGFHTAGYSHDFLANCQQSGFDQIENQAVKLSDHTVRVAEFPMGIDYAKYAAARKSKPVKQAVKRYLKKYRGKKIIVAVDRLDPSKGLIERLEAYREFLARNHKLHGKVVFAMVAAPSRTDIPTYQKLSRRLDELAAEINKKFGTAKWQPLDYMHISQPFEEVAALFQIADVGFIAPLKDGMNLAAKEFVASNRGRGVLILSQTAGAAEELQDALLVDPHKPETVVAALEQSLHMRRTELRRRLKRMKKYLSVHTVQNWATTFVDTLQQPVPGTPHLTRTLNKRLEKVLLTDARHARRRLLLLDYDGSLVPFTADYHDALPPRAVVQLIEKLCNDKANEVVLISGRDAEDLGNWFGRLPINLVAEHGAMVRKTAHKNWQTIERTDTAWKKLLIPALERYVRLAPGARLEIKPHSLVWHYRSVSPYYAQKYSVTIKRVLKPILKTYGLELLQGNKVLEIKNPQINKGVAAQRWLKDNYEFILSIGDDMTDEELFEILPLEAYSIKVGRGRTAARFRLSTHKEVLSLLKKVAKA